jgi:hypothetical protein
MAALRVAVAGMMLATNEPRDALGMLADRLPWAAPEGLGWIAANLGPSPAVFSFTRAAYFAYYVSAVLSLLGLYTRAALSVLLASALVLFGVVQLSGAAVHDMHLLWFLTILIACPSGDALSIDEWFRTSRGDGVARRLLGAKGGTMAFAMALFFVRTLLGFVYFFPGLWKLRESGLAWAMSDNLVYQMHAKWLEFGFVPSPRIDRAPAVVHALGLFTLAFELGFLMLVHVGPRTRLALAGAGLAFHLGIEHFLLIPFSSLWTAYVVLLPIGAERTWNATTPGGTRAGARGGTSALGVLGSALIVAEAVQGIRGKTQAYPFACYPTFQWIAGPTLVDLELIALGDDGDDAAWPIPHGRDSRGKRTQMEWATIWSVAGAYGAPFSRLRLDQYLQAERRRRPEVELAMVGARAVRADLVWRLTDPDAWGSPPVEKRTLAVTPLRGP